MRSTTIKISVYITSYNQCAYLREAVDSVLAQTRRPHEIIIVDDASTDGSRDFISECVNKHSGLIKSVFHERNKGVAAARNSAIAAVTGDVVTYVDGDDRMLPGKLEREAAALENRPDADFAYSNHFNIDVAGERLDCWIEVGRPPEGDVLAATFAREFPRRDIFRMELVRMSALRSVGLHDPSLPAFEDFDLRLRLARAARAIYVDEPLFEIRRHGGGLSSASAATKLGLLRKLYARHRGILCNLPPDVQRHARRRLLGWMAGFAQKAAYAALGDPSLSMLERRSAFARHIWFCMRHAPDRMTLGDGYRLLLPARMAEKLCDR